MSPIFEKLAKENNKSAYTNVTDIFLKVLDNILKAPDNPKYRKLKLSNETVCGTILPAEGATECLQYFGFELVDEEFIMPQTVSIPKLQSVRDELFEARKSYASHSGEGASATKNLAAYASPFFEEIRSYSKRVLLYERNELRAAARGRIPLAELNRRFEKKKTSEMEEFEKEFGLLYELMMWFKDEFFSWMDSPKCTDCDNSPSTFVGLSHDPSQLIYTDRVEVYICDRCRKQLSFPRYNNPALLLKTRTGRCGEWANCFTLMCRVVGYDARFVVDRTDHVWTEVYSDAQKKWIHCDPCEGTIDAPLQYELGWGKKLTYVLAFSKDEVQDVTWRYTTQFDQVRARRKECSEASLLECILDLSEQLQSSLPAERRKYLARRRLIECVEFMTPPHSDKQYGGRSSGSLQWRLSRSECKTESDKYTWTPNSAELEQRRFHVRYSTAQDRYYRVGNNETLAGWANGIFESVSVFRKVERDWKMCYLCRVEGASSASIKWKFSLERTTGLVIGRIKVRYQCSLYETGSVNMILCNEETCLRLDPKKNECETDEFHGSTELSLSAVMDGGVGSSAWQHAQLFRQSIDDTSCPFELDISLVPPKQ